MNQNVKYIKFSWHDCWILLSIPNRKEGGKLHEIVRMSDVLNHAVPTKKEMEIGLTKGLQAGFSKSAFVYPGCYRDGLCDLFTRAV